ncbi:GAMM1 protein [Clavulina sp. PMI_390]|nr:GAMM1 protein [Clavulina sp. PMI_390]
MASVIGTTGDATLVSVPGLSVAPIAVADSDSDSQPASKKVKTELPTIGTHNGTFHCDEALAVFLLRLTSTYKDAKLVRTRDPATLDTCDIVVDVGAVYDPAALRFDHHQRGFTENFGHGFVTKLSSAGLIYKHYGEEIISTVQKIPINSPTISALYLKLYREFIEAIDGIDNGVNQYPKEAEPLYKSSTNLSSRVGFLNPRWNQTFSNADVDARFEQASKLTGSEFLDRLSYYAEAWLPAREIVEPAFSSRRDVHPSGRIILFTSFAPWKEHLFDIESEQQATAADHPYYIIYPDETGGNWRVQAVPVSPDSFDSRKALPEVWRGLRDDKLSEVSGIPGGIFVHASGFIGGNKTQEGALALATKALEL